MTASRAMELTPWQVIGGAVGSAASGGGVSAFFNWLGTRDRAQAYAKGLVDRAMSEALKGVSDQLSRADRRMEEIEAQHQQCEVNLREVNRRLDETERERELERTRLKAEIDRLMTEPVPGYEPRKPK